MNRLRFISQVLYRLKRRYGELVMIYFRITNTTNLETGAKSITTGARKVLRVIVLPSVIHREFVYDLTFIASNKAFTYGGHFDTTERRFIFDRKDLPDFEIKVGMYIVFSGHRYDIRQVEEFEDKTGYLVIAKQAIEAVAPLYAEAVSEIDLTAVYNETAASNVLALTDDAQAYKEIPQAASNALALTSDAQAYKEIPQSVSDTLALTSDASNVLVGGGFGSNNLLAALFFPSEIWSIDKVTTSGTLLKVVTYQPYFTAKYNATKLAYTSITEISTLDFDDTDTLIFGPDSGGATGIDADEPNGHLYFSTRDTGSDGVKRINIGGTGLTTLVASGDVDRPFGLRLDLVNSYIYFVERFGKKVSRCALTGSPVTNLVTGVTGQPFGIALDIAGGKIYWTEIDNGLLVSGDRVMRCNLNGTGVEVLFNHGATVVGKVLSQPLGIAVDVSASKLYWSDSFNHRIIRCNLDSTSPEVFWTMPSPPADGTNADPHGLTFLP